MSIKINRLKIRMPAGTSARPEAFAKEIAHGLAQHGPGAVPQQTVHLQLRLRPGHGNVTTQVTDAVARALHNRGQS